MIRVAINGFGRIGRRIFRLAHDRQDVEIVAINDIADSKTLSHLLKYDSIHGLWKKDITYGESAIIFESKRIPLFKASHPKEISWHNLDVDYVLECSGRFKTYEQLNFHIKNGAKKVILSVPPFDESIKMLVMGVNESEVFADDLIISNASCTTNNAAPVIKVLDDLCGVEQAYITTVHSYTSDQSLHDQPHSDLRRARAAGQSIVPTTTGAAKALTRIFPNLSEVIGGCGIRVPVANGSLTDFTVNVSRETSIAEINRSFLEASQTYLSNILEYTSDPIVSVDIIGNTHSCIFDSQMTSVIGKMVKIVGWYDNETGYSSRILDLICNLSDKYARLSNK